MPPKTSNLFIFLMGRKIILCKGSEKFEKVSKREGIIVFEREKEFPIPPLFPFLSTKYVESLPAKIGSQSFQKAVT